MGTRNLHPVCVSLLLALGVSGSGCTIAMVVPDRFLVVQDEWGSKRALTPEESKLWVREFDDDSKGTLAFWSEALKADLIKSRGYTLVEEATVKDANGRAGMSMVLETTLSGRPVRELLAVFVVPGWWSNTIRVVEYVADKDAFATEVEGVRTSLGTLH